jgi:hypothetical protein
MRIQQYNYIVCSLDYFAGCTPMRIQQRGSKICSVKTRRFMARLGALLWGYNSVAAIGVYFKGLYLRDVKAHLSKNFGHRDSFLEIAMGLHCCVSDIQWDMLFGTCFLVRCIMMQVSLYHVGCAGIIVLLITRGGRFLSCVQYVIRTALSDMHRWHVVFNKDVRWISLVKDSEPFLGHDDALMRRRVLNTCVMIPKKCPLYRLRCRGCSLSVSFQWR